MGSLRDVPPYINSALIGLKWEVLESLCFSCCGVPSYLRGGGGGVTANLFGYIESDYLQQVMYSAPKK